MAENVANAPVWGPNNKHRLLNSSLPRVDAPFKTTGTAQYTFDVRVPGMLQARVLRCPHANATVKSFDDSAAMRIPGVRAVVRSNANLAYEGAPVAAVAADTIEIADDAVHALVVEYDVLPHVVKYEDAIKPNAPIVPGGRGGGRRGGGAPAAPAGPPSNVNAGQKRGDPAAVAAALAGCDAVVEAEYRNPIWHHTCLETHGVVVDYHGGDNATVYCSTQSTFAILGDAARILGLDAKNIVGIVQNMGGGFGSKGGGAGIAGQLAYMLSKKLQMPVKLMVNRRDEFLFTGNGPGSVQKMKAGAKKDGTLVAMDARQFALPGIGTQGIRGQPNIYTVGTSYSENGTVRTNEDASVALRAPGAPQACYAMECMMDELAEKIGMDPIEFRKKNLPANTAETYLRQLDRGAKEIGWERRKPSGQWPGTKKRGFGCGIGNWGGGGRQGNVVDLTITQDGAITASVGSQDLGTGTRTYIRAIVAEELGLEMNDVQEKIGDTRLPNASGSGGSTTAASLAPVVKDAAFNARKMMAERVAPVIGATADQITFADGKVSGNGKSLTWKQACATLPTAGLAARGQFQANLASNNVQGASFAEVEVDTETGHVQVIRMCHVQNVGLPLNRLACESQINGGMISGISMALYEGRVTDADLGVMINPAFTDYKLAGALEMPELIPIIDDGDNREAVVGVGEPPAVPGAGAVANAIFNACGVRVRDLPITPDKILMGLQKPIA
jgi:xanthine dehydrogenase YagR molybdenum-binding subunit